ncbi:hypothetical protein RND71_018311 [Anisodus tanguticus]|uniref:Uncharacterized protein n=1 Tax=Anisodus tanguticus TaxID=243964 RepID=A0AAE1VK34_9SOLA|nr:hypothetical protein RND71_018311 [Anisodus tanguticus]
MCVLGTIFGLCEGIWIAIFSWKSLLKLGSLGVQKFSFSCFQTHNPKATFDDSLHVSKVIGLRAFKDQLGGVNEHEINLFTRHWNQLVVHERDLVDYLNFTLLDELLHQIQLQKDDVHKQYVDLWEIIRERLGDDFYKEIERIRTELEVSRKKTEELLDEKREQSEVCSDNLDILQLAKHGLLRLVDNLNFRVDGTE